MSDKLIGHYGNGIGGPTQVDPSVPVTPTTPGETYFLGGSAWHESTLITMHDGSTKAIKDIVVGDRVRTMAPVCSTSGLTYDYTLAINPADNTLVAPLAVNTLARQLPPVYIDIGNGLIIDQNVLPVANTESYSFTQTGWRDVADITWVAGEALVSDIGVSVHVVNFSGGIFDNFFAYSVRALYNGTTPQLATCMAAAGYNYASAFVIEYTGESHALAARSMGVTQIDWSDIFPLRLLKPTAYPLPGGWGSNTSNFKSVTSVKNLAAGGGAWTTTFVGRYFAMQLRRNGAQTPLNASHCFFANGYLVY